MEIELIASIKCADHGRLEDEIKALENGGIDSFHIDIMDGGYIPEFGMSCHNLEFMALATDRPLEIHLMTEYPNNRIAYILSKLRPGDTVLIHPEAEYHPSTTLQKIMDAGMFPGIVVNEGMSLESVRELLYIVKKVLVMPGKPENPGQGYGSSVWKKIERLLQMKQDMGFTLEWEGTCSRKDLAQLAVKGIDGFILGHSFLFGKGRSYREIIDEIRRFG